MLSVSPELKSSRKVLIQRVRSGSVTVAGNEISKIGYGLVVLVGISRTDSTQELQSMVNALINLPVFFDSKNNKWESLQSTSYEVLLVSQFTLYAVLSKGKKPDFHNAMAPKGAREVYEQFVNLMKEKLAPDRVKDGQFGAMMQVKMQNEGFTTQIDSIDL